MPLAYHVFWAIFRIAVLPRPTAALIAMFQGGVALQLILGSTAFSYILLYVAAVYWIMAPQLFRHARRIVDLQAANPS